jgi:hypothetical protein
VVNVITKSGTNRFKGTLNYVLDSTYDDALTNQQSQDPELQARGRPGFGIEQFWGGTFGGPIKKNRTFFFGAFQEDRIRSNSTRVLNTLSAQGRATLNTVFPKGTNPNVDLYNALTAGADATSQFTTQELGNGRPAIQFGTAVQGLSTWTLDRQYLGRVDHKISDADQLSGRFIYQTINTPKGALINVFPGFEADAITKNVSASITETHIFSPTLTNELRLNYMRLNPLFPVSNPDNELVKTAPQIAIAGLTSQDPQMLRAAYPAMALIARFVIVPLSFAPLVTGPILSLGTPWGLFRHYWVLLKFLLTVSATIILLLHMPTITRVSRMAADMTLPIASFGAVQRQLVIHATGGLLVLLAATVLSIYKPWGLTPYGRRRMLQPTMASIGASATSISWKLYVLFGFVGLLILLIILHLIGGGFPHH